MSATWETQKVLVAQLKADSTLMALIDGVFDTPDTNNAYNYIQVGDVIEVNEDTLSYNGYDLRAIFKIYTKPEGLGTYTAKKILINMNRVLHTKKFTMSGFNMIICKYDSSSNFTHKDVKGMIVRYKVLVDTDTLITF